LAASSLVSVRNASEMSAVCCAREEQRDVDGTNPVSDRADKIEGGVVAADVDAGEARTGDDEARHRADQPLASLRTVARWNAGD
jgi:hypothetical protein